MGAAVFALLATACSSSSPTSTPTTTVPTGGTPSAGRGTFTYGFDFSTQGPTTGAGNDSASVSSAQHVLSRFAGSYMDQSIWGFGATTSPEPSPGKYNMSAIARRIHLIDSVGGIPVITLVSAPNWMKDPAASSANLFRKPPSPSHFADFAALCAHVAASFPQVKYFVVWSELRGFFLPKSKSWDGPGYTKMYNDVYAAIKAVRPDAQIGGPYANLSASSVPIGGASSTLKGSWGYLDQSMADAMSYWLAHKAGAEFVAVDGGTEIAKADNPTLTDIVTASQKYAAVDHWIRSQTDLPIWWMESHIQPHSGWTSQQAATARIATLLLMASSGASVGMQWQPQEQSNWPDQGLWTSTLNAGGGRPTLLADELQQVLPVLSGQVVLMAGEPAGVLVARTGSHTIAVNTTGAIVHAVVTTGVLTLAPYSLSVR